jgi:signal transduction histidine kinase
MALVLVATGLFVSLRFRTGLDHTLDQGLRARAGAVSALVQQADTGLQESAGTGASEPGADFAQVLDARTGAVVDATAGLERRPLLVGSDLHTAAHRTVLLERASAATAEGRARLLAAPVHAQDRALIVVVGASLEDRDGALAKLRAELLLGGPIALLLASLAGYGLTTAALRPIREMVDRLTSGLARERAFTADASHELRTPLTMLTTELQLIARDRPRGAELDAAVGAATEEAHRLAALLGDLLVLARADEGELPAAGAPVVVAELARAVADRYSGPGDTIVVDVPAGLRVRGDRDQLDRALGNLAANALRHGGSPVELAAVPRDGTVELHVRDRGPGIAQAFLPRAFDRFSRLHAGQADGGTGLGLAIVAAIAGAHGGSAHAANRPDGGADVWIAIPSAPRLTLSERAASTDHARDDLHQPARPDPAARR